MDSVTMHRSQRIRVCQDESERWERGFAIRIQHGQLINALAG